MRGRIFLRVLSSFMHQQFAVQYDCYQSVQKSSRACAPAKRPPSGRAWSERTAIASSTRSWSDAGRNSLPTGRRSLTSAKTSGASPSECDVRASQLVSRQNLHRQNILRQNRHDKTYIEQNRHATKPPRQNRHDKTDIRQATCKLDCDCLRLFYKQFRPPDARD